MCGRYYIDDLTAESIFQAVESLSFSAENLRGNANKRYLVSGEIFPGNQADVLQIASGKRTVEEARWGFDLVDKSLLINARCETIGQKAMFRPLFEHSRCVVPASGFYEWRKNGKSKQKCALKNREGRIFMAGITRINQNQKEFVILTANANDSVRQIHHRMPLILAEDQIIHWLSDRNFAYECLRFPCDLVLEISHEEPGQTSFFD